jgi:iron complex transport system substrate-binding protein
LKLNFLELYLTFLALSLYSEAYCAIEVVDEDGNLIKLEKPAERIISLAPSVTELLFAIGAGSQVVGVIEYSDFPPEAKTLQVVGRFDLLDIEKILELEPDLIIGWKSGNPRTSIEQLKRLGLSVYLVELNDLPSISTQMESLSKLAGTAVEAKEAINHFNQTYESLVTQYGNLESVRTFYQVWESPIITTGGKELMNDIIELCSGENIFKAIDQIAPKVSLEAVIIANPEVIIGSGVGLMRPEWLNDWEIWPSVKAVSEEHVYFIPPDLVQRQTPRTLIGTKQMCEHIAKARVD